MNNRYSLLFYLPLFLAAAVVLFSNNDSENSQHAEYAINKVIGDESYITFFGEEPDKNTPEQLRIRTHLLYVEDVLRKRPTNHISTRQKKNRTHNLNLLRQYIEIGKFPRNDGHPDPRRPTFIDNKGTICAVGYLVEQTTGRNAAKSLNEKYKYAYISQIDDSVFNNWAKQSGLTKRELAMIQPAYGGRQKETQPKPEVEASYGIATGLLATANALYLTNHNSDPWMLSSSRAIHWYGLTVGTASTLLGAFNLDNESTYTARRCGFAGCVSETKTQVRKWRHGISVANMTIGVISIARSAYYLIKQPEARREFSKTQVDLTQISTYQPIATKPVPALKFKYNF